MLRIDDLCPWWCVLPLFFPFGRITRSCSCPYPLRPAPAVKVVVLSERHIVRLGQCPLQGQSFFAKKKPPACASAGGDWRLLATRPAECQRADLRLMTRIPSFWQGNHRSGSGNNGEHLNQELSYMNISLPIGAHTREGQRICITSKNKSISILVAPQSYGRNQAHEDNHRPGNRDYDSLSSGHTSVLYVTVVHF